MIEALAPHTPKKAFTDGIRSRDVIGRFEHTDATRVCDTSKVYPKLAIVTPKKGIRPSRHRRWLLAFVARPKRRSEIV